MAPTKKQILKKISLSAIISITCLSVTFGLIWRDQPQKWKKGEERKTFLALFATYIISLGGAIGLSFSNRWRELSLKIGPILGFSVVFDIIMDFITGMFADKISPKDTKTTVSMIVSMYLLCIHLAACSYIAGFKTYTAALACSTVVADLLKKRGDETDNSDLISIGFVAKYTVYIGVTSLIYFSLKPVIAKVLKRSPHIANFDQREERSN